MSVVRRASRLVAAGIRRIAPLTVAAALAVGGPTAGSATLRLVDDPVAATMADAGDTTDVLLRITRDYNNDGLPDRALGWRDSCGNKTCLFTLFLRRAGGGYARAGDLGGLPFGFRLVPVSPGRARWETCTASGREVKHVSFIVSPDGMGPVEVRAVAPGESESLGKWTGRFTWEECSAEQYRRGGACQWRMRSWPEGSR